MRIPMIRAAAVATAAIASVAVGAPSAQAAAPVMTDVNVDLTIPVGDLCSFPVDVHVVQTGTETDFFAADGALTQIIFRTVEQDTFSANGNTLSGLPYVNELRVVFDNTGQVVHAYATGIIERVPL